MDNQYNIRNIKDLLDSLENLEYAAKKETDKLSGYYFSGINLVIISIIFISGFLLNETLAVITGFVGIFIVIGVLLTEFHEKVAKVKIDKKLNLPTKISEVESLLADANIQKTILNYIIGEYNKYPNILNNKDIYNLQLLFINKKYYYARKRILEVFSLLENNKIQQEKIQSYNVALKIDNMIEHEACYDLKAML